MTVIKVVLSTYSPKEFWSKVGKGLYRHSIFNIFRKKEFRWDKTTSEWFEEFDEMENDYGTLPMLEPLGETSREFFIRLASALFFKHHLDEEERVKMSLALSNNKTFLKTKSQFAQGIILKGFLELSRVRPEPPLSFFGYDLVCHIRTIEELLNFPLEKKLPLVREIANNPFYTRKMLDQDYASLSPDTPEYHIVLSYKCGDLSYCDSVREMAVGYTSLTDAFTAIKNKKNRNESEKAFFEKFEYYNNRVNGMLPQVL